LLTVLAYICDFIGWIVGKKMKLTPFTVRLLTMHRWFSFERAERDLRYKPIIPFKEGYEETIQWFKKEWLPTYLDRDRASSYGGIYKGSQMKIDGQYKKVPETPCAGHGGDPVQRMGADQ